MECQELAPSSNNHLTFSHRTESGSPVENLLQGRDDEGAEPVVDVHDVG